jgi:hypothetical protein
MTLKGRSVLDRPSYGLAEGILRFCGAAKLSLEPLLTGNGNSVGLSILVHLACKLRNLR